MTLTLAVGRPTLVDSVFSRHLVTDIALIAAAAAFVSLAAQLAVPLWPVPITGQTLAVLVVGASLGALRGALALTAYALLGIVGLPVYSDAASGWDIVAGPTGGYIVGFIAAAALTGWVAQRRWDHRFLGAVLSFSAGTLVTFVFGLPWLAAALDLDLMGTLQAGLLPFLIGGVVKAVLAAWIMHAAWGAVERADDRVHVAD